MASTHQCFDAQVEQLTYRRQPPPASGTRAGRSSEAAPNWSLVSVATVSKWTPSRDRPTMLANPRPSSTGRRNR